MRDIIEELDSIWPKFSSIVIVVDTKEFVIFFGEILDSFDVPIFLSFRVIEREVGKIIS